MGRLAQKTISRHKNLTLEFQEMRFARPDFEEAVVGIRKKFFINTKLFLDDSPKGDTETMSYFDNGDIDIAVRSLLKGFGLPTSWFEIVFFYVISNGILFRKGMLKENFSGLILEHRNAGLGSMELVLKIGPETSYSDLKAAWDEIKRVSSVGNTRKRKRDNFERDLDIFKYHIQGFSLPQICLKVEKNYTGDIKEETIRKVITETYDRYSTPTKYRKKIRTK